MAKSALAGKTLAVFHVLLVEDTPSDAFALERLLEDVKAAHYKTHCVNTQSAALAALDERTFDVCLLDLTLPDANGFSALIDIQRHAPDMPVLILTGINDTQLARRAVGRGAQDFLLKDEMEITGLVRAIDYAVERKQVEKELFQRANCDSLTGLANRESFLSRLGMSLARSERSKTGVAVLFIDLDRFKPINDIYGHDAGDETLKTAAARIQAALRSYDTPARLGGDEFVVLLEGITNSRDAANIAQKIIKSLATPMPYHKHSLEIGSSIGIAFTNTPMAPETLVQQADTAMYHVKNSGGGEYRFYSDEMHRDALARLKLEEDLRVALETQELRLHYQPYVTLDDNRIAGIEALLRWQHPQHGILCAQEFLCAAESARLMPEIVEWACAQLKRDIAMWNTYALPPMTIAVNLSLSQLDAPELIEYFIEVAAQELLGAHRLAIEIPEEAITPISGARFMAVARLHELGIGLHLDHFGCCSLPLTTLTSLPFSMLKIDMSLVQNMQEDAPDHLLIGAAILLAHHLGLKISAVGVEQSWQAQMLKHQSCDTVQGNLMAPPMTAGELATRLQAPG